MRRLLVVLALPFMAAFPVALISAALGAGTGSAGAYASPAPASLPPAAMLVLYRQSAATCPGLPWTVLAAIGTVESANGASTAAGVHSGANSAGAEGPMQFEPATFARYALPVPPGGASPPSPYDAADAVYAAARDLCANGARGGADLAGAVYAYNHAGWYVDKVLSLARAYGRQLPGGGSAPAAGAVAYALAALGTPYRWGGAGPAGFDCSGLVQAAYASAGTALPRTAQAQFDAGRVLAPGTPMVPGDLIFFGTSVVDVTHVGIYVGGGDMVDAPHTGAAVRREPYRWPDYVGATRPAP